MQDKFSTELSTPIIFFIDVYVKYIKNPWFYHFTFQKSMKENTRLFVRLWVLRGFCNKHCWRKMLLGKKYEKVV